ncbi:MAG TPA: hypothetical protein VJZ49_10860 [Syntrophales bacterium]|nr:hypothetical protein [Syntrophales bacterium]
MLIGRIDLVGWEVYGKATTAAHFPADLSLTNNRISLAGLQGSQEFSSRGFDLGIGLFLHILREAGEVNIVVVIEPGAMPNGVVDEYGNILEGNTENICQGLNLTGQIGDLSHIDGGLCDRFAPAFIGDEAHGIPELVGRLHHVHEAGIHPQEVNLLAKECADCCEDNIQFPVVQGIAVGGIVIADAAVFLRNGVAVKVAALLSQPSCAALFFLIPPAAAVIPED